MVLMLAGVAYIFCQTLGFISEYAESKRLRENKISILTMADVGQGDGFMVRLWSGHTFLVDVGEYGERFLSAIRKPSFHNFGKKESLHADLIFLSHDDADHAGALNNVWKDFKLGDAIGSIVTSLYHHTNIDELNRQDRIIKTVSGESFEFADSANIKILWPKKEIEYSRRSTNDDSIVMKVTIASTSILFTGDISDKIEKNLIEKFDEELKVDILKVGHHGSKSSSMNSFIKITDPQIALISAGKNNRYKHPSTQAMKRLKQDGREIIRTDQCGTVRIMIFDGGVVGKTACL